MLGKNQKPTLVCLRKGGPSYKAVSWKCMEGRRWSLKGLEKVESFLPLSLSPSFSIQIGFSAGMCSSKEVQALQ